MIKRKVVRKIIITTFSFLTLLMVVIIPSGVDKNQEYLNTKIDTLYVNNIGTIDIFLLNNNNYLTKFSIILNTEDNIEKIKGILNYLTVNSNNKIPDGLRGIIPKKTVVNDVKIFNKIATLDFSKEFLDITPTIEERLIEAITYSIINIDGVEGIIINVEGNRLINLPSSREKLPEILDRNYGINKVFDIDNIHNIQKVVLYYTENINSDIYYVPVTKYLNDDREKIKIIIENLSGNYIYDNNLISMVSNKTELIDYKFENRKMILDFNDGILSNGKLLEEVVCLISESVFSNYDSDEIVIRNNGNDIKIIKK